jgi:hypothetical protein
MTDQWIRAADALQLLQPRLSAHNAAMAICRRAHAGLVRAKAARFIHPQAVNDDLKVPADFWWAEGNEALGQSWETGDFETWVDGKFHFRAFDVSFALGDIHDILGLSPDSKGNFDHWLAARDALKRVCDATGKSPALAASLIITHCRIGHIEAQAEELTIRYRNPFGEQVEDEGDAQPVPDWFWNECTDNNASAQDWERGVFSGRGIVYDKTSNVKLIGVQFKDSDLSVFDNMIEVALETETLDGQKGSQGGRRQSKAWPDWIAELVSHIHEEGCPPGEGSQGQEAIIGAVANRLAKRGIDGPSRSTVQTAVRAVLDRLRSAGN